MLCSYQASVSTRSVYLLHTLKNHTNHKVLTLCALVEIPHQIEVPLQLERQVFYAWCGGGENNRRFKHIFGETNVKLRP